MIDLNFVILFEIFYFLILYFFNNFPKQYFYFYFAYYGTDVLKFEKRL